MKLISRYHNIQITLPDSPQVFIDMTPLANSIWEQGVDGKDKTSCRLDSIGQIHMNENTRKAIPVKPEPPKGRLVCDICGEIESPDKHTFFLCKLSKWFANIL